MECEICKEEKGHLAGCSIGENEIVEMPDIEDVKPVFLN